MLARSGALGNRRAEAFSGPDFYPTPAWATRALLSKEIFLGSVREPCCGDGAMALALIGAGLDVVSSDLFAHGFGASGIDARALAGPAANIITNPPFNAAEAMLARFLEICEGKTALLLRLSFLESKRRHPLFAKSPPARVHVFSERLSLYKAGAAFRGGGTISYGWFVWERGHIGGTCLGWIPPGFKAAESKRGSVSAAPPNRNLARTP